MRTSRGTAAVVGDPPALALDVVPDVGPERRAFLGVDGDRPFFAVELDESDTDESFRSLRDVGLLLGARDAGLVVNAVALANWHATHTHCPRCAPPPGSRRPGTPACARSTAASTTRAPTRP